jgi:hypothetical protein
MVDTYNYTEGETNNFTHLNFYKYVRPRPSAALQKNPTGFITLPMPINLPSDYYSMDVAGTNLGLAGNLTGISEGESMTRVRDTLRERLNSRDERASGYTAQDIGNILAAAVGAAPGIADFGKYVTPAVIDTLASTTGYVRNPHSAVIFNNVNLRQFTLHWRLSPRSQNGSKTLNDIIKFIKQKMHPSLAPGGFALDYPDLVTASFNNDKEGIANIDYSFIADFHIDPTSQGHIYYKEGYPTFVDMQMTLKEIRIKTAEDFKNKSSDVSSQISNGIV